MARYVFITGGVVSSLGKGLASAALGSLLQARGFTVRLRNGAVMPCVALNWVGDGAFLPDGGTLLTTCVGRPAYVHATHASTPRGT